MCGGSQGRRGKGRWVGVTVFTPCVCFLPKLARWGNNLVTQPVFLQTLLFLLPPPPLNSLALPRSVSGAEEAVTPLCLLLSGVWRGAVAQCVLVKALPHLPAIIRQLCWKNLSLIPLWWPIFAVHTHTHKEKDRAQVLLVAVLQEY